MALTYGLLLQPRPRQPEYRKRGPHTPGPLPVDRLDDILNGTAQDYAGDVWAEPGAPVNERTQQERQRVSRKGGQAFKESRRAKRMASVVKMPVGWSGSA